MNGSDTVRLALRERVARKVAGSGISPRAIERAVDAVVAALPASARADGAAGQPEVIVTLSARSVPDLGSRVRAVLLKEGITVADVAVATAGQHTVVTLRAPAAAREKISRIAEAQKASFTLIDADAAAGP